MKKAGWIVASAVALLAMSRWLSATSVGYLLLGATATAVAAALLFAATASDRRWSGVCVGALGMAVLLAANSQTQLARLEDRWPAERERLAGDALAVLTRDVGREAERLQGLARAALGAPADRSAAFGFVQDAAPSPDETVVLFRGDSAFAWAGRPRVPLDSLDRPIGVAAMPFYLALYATADQPGARAVASRLLYALPPADRIAASMAGDAAQRAGVAGFEFAPAPPPAGAGWRVVHSAGADLFAVRPVVPMQGEVQLHLLERARLLVGVCIALALACFVVAAWRAQQGLRWRAALVVIGLACVAFTPLSAYSNYSRLFDPALYFTPLGRSLTANAAALALTSALVLLLLLTAVRRQARMRGRLLAVAIVLIAAGLGPFLLRDLARGIQIPSYGVSASLWLIWEVPLFLAAVSIILAGAAAGGAALGGSRGLPPIVSPVLAVLSAVIAPVVWQAPGQWPWWYTFLWVAAIGSLAVSRRTSAVVVTAATVAALGAATLVWGATTRARVRLAEQDIASLGTGDVYARTLAQRLGERFTDSPARDRRALLEAYATSDLASAGFPVWLAAWQSPAIPSATLSTAPMSVPVDDVRPLVARASAAHAPVEGVIQGSPALEHALAVPTDSGIITIVVAPRSRLMPADPFAELLGVESAPAAEPPYTLQIASTMDSQRAGTRPTWRREENELHGDWVAPTGAGLARVHAEVELRPLFALMQRGTLIVLLDLGIVALLWLTSVLADGSAQRWVAVRWRRWSRSYRIRLTLALFAFFMLPAIAFAVWSYQQLAADAARARELLVRETLRSVTPNLTSSAWLAGESRRVDAPLFAYEGGALRTTSDSLLGEIAPIGRMLPPEIAEALLVHGEVGAHRVERVGRSRTLFGYRALDMGGAVGVIAAPARADDLTLGRRARDLGILVMFATAIGALAALWLSGIAARQLARPIGSLRQAALALAGGEREPRLEGEPTAEFLPVFAAFRRMVSDLNASRSALEEAQRRTAAVLRNAASGVIAVDERGIVTLANPRADELLGVRLPPGTNLSAMAPPELAAAVHDFLASDRDDADFEMPHGEQQWRGRLTRLTRGGAVVTLDDVSEIARAQRVLAWGEMARQIAHEIKNPLTPIRLGVQHLQRARSDRRVDFDRVLDQNVERILKEIDRLDEIARAFSRYGQPPEQRPSAEATDVAAVLRDLVDLESLGDAPVRVTLAGAERPALALARADELREVLLNVVENARLARATRVAITLASNDGKVQVAVTDNGHGIAADVLPRIFEPHFSTRTSGSGLGLAVSRRMIESWGGAIEIASAPERGTEVRIELKAVE
ncbi:MAG TPA: ATP-binding protein [Gemmatimonadaceae bacterium]|nr:ATP-binding protein [Gemmatimonadaceae bacterium]